VTGCAPVGELTFIDWPHPSKTTPPSRQSQPLPGRVNRTHTDTGEQAVHSPGEERTNVKELGRLTP